MQYSNKAKQQPKQLTKQDIHIPLLELIAVNNTAKARNLLKKCGKEDAVSYADLESRLSDLYAGAKDKLEIEMEFANIHPHKDFILKNLAPPPTKTKVIIPEKTAPADGVESSSLEGEVKLIPTQPPVDTKPPHEAYKVNSISLVAIVGIVALVSVYIIHSKNKYR